MAVGAKWDTVFDIIISGDNMVHLHTMQPSSNTTTATAIGEELRCFYVIKAHGTLSLLYPPNAANQPRGLLRRLN
jgi:hypothetical protein